MVTLVAYKWITAVLIFIISAILPMVFLTQRKTMRHGESMTLGEAFAAGIFLGTAFFHLLPDAAHIFSARYQTISYPVPGAVCVASILLFFILERLSLSYRQTGGKKTVIPGIVIAILVIHAITEGAALGIGSVFSETIMLSLAIIAHKGSEAFALAVILLRHGWQSKKVMQLSLLFAAMTPLGIVLGTNLTLMNFEQSALLDALFSSFAAGTFIYIGTLHHLHGQTHVHEENIKHLLFVAFGVLIMGLLALFPH